MSKRSLLPCWNIHSLLDPMPRRNICTYLWAFSSFRMFPLWFRQFLPYWKWVSYSMPSWNILKHDWSYCCYWRNWMHSLCCWASLQSRRINQSNNLSCWLLLIPRSSLLLYLLSWILLSYYWNLWHCLLDIEMPCWLLLSWRNCC